MEERAQVCFAVDLEYFLLEFLHGGKVEFSLGIHDKSVDLFFSISG